jgi:hypothetical protein
MKIKLYVGKEFELYLDDSNVWSVVKNQKEMPLIGEKNMVAGLVILSEDQNYFLETVKENLHSYGLSENLTDTLPLNEIITYSFKNMSKYWCEQSLKWLNHLKPNIELIATLKDKSFSRKLSQNVRMEILKFLKREGN